MLISVSVRNLVEFILRSGNIDNRRTVSADNAMLEGGKAHRKIQSRMGVNYRAEVSLKKVISTDRYDLKIEGRADGIIDLGDGQYEIDEIKGTYRDLMKIKEPVEVHLAQAMCYAYIYASEQELSQMGVRVTYCNLEDTDQIKYFESSYSFEYLEQWFTDLVKKYLVWTDLQYDWNLIRQQSLQEMEFPFEYREGQKELVTYAYQTIYHKKKLFIEAPTGVGKTISTVFPSLKATGVGLADKLFYLTAKTITRTVADDTIQLLRRKGLKFKSIILTAKDKICFQEETECNPFHCPYALGHYDRINDAIYDLITHEESFSREVIEEYARKHQVCPFEFSLDVSLFSDGIICDYNYLFDPHVYLKRFFSEGESKDYIFLIDEAHNLLDRGRNMYSAVLCKEDFMELKRAVKEADSRMAKQLEKCNKEMLGMKRMCNGYQVDVPIDSFVMQLSRLSAMMESYLEDHEDGELRKKILEFYFEVSHFLLINDLMDDHYVVYSEMLENGYFALRLYNVDPSRNLQQCMLRGRSSVLFSATLLPIQYYKKLLGGEETDYEVYAESTFNPQKRGLFIASDVTSKYSRRGKSEYYSIARYIDAIVNQRFGNYMVFFPSHSFLKNVLEVYLDYFGSERVECIVQESNMSEQDREVFLGRFQGNLDCDLESQIDMEVEMEEETSLVGFCVMGGLFSEGIDLKNDSLIGAIIVGTGIPQVCYENEILKSYFDEKDGAGFDYAYKYPGMNKVLQAAGRVIRTHDDVGIVALLDERFTGYQYQKMFPREWTGYEIITGDTVGNYVTKFWDKWL